MIHRGLIYILVLVTHQYSTVDRRRAKSSTVALVYYAALEAPSSMVTAFDNHAALAGS